MAQSAGKSGKSARVITSAEMAVSDMPSGATFEVDLTLDAAQLREGQAQLDLIDLKKVRLTGSFKPSGKSDWMFEGNVGASATQACVVTLAPVKTRFDAPVSREYVAEWDAPEPDSVAEMDENVTREPLPRVFDLMDLALEVISLELPDYPKAEGAELEQAVFAEPGVVPMTDEDAKPFAGLAGLKEKLEKQSDS